MTKRILAAAAVLACTVLPLAAYAQTSGVAAGATTGAVGGAIVGGPIGAVVAACIVVNSVPSKRVMKGTVRTTLDQAGKNTRSTNQ